MILIDLFATIAQLFGLLFVASSMLAIAVCSNQPFLEMAYSKQVHS